MRRPLVLLLLLPSLLPADGGKLILRGGNGGETISVFADPFPIRAGEPCDLSVLVQKGDEPLLNGTVTLVIGGKTQPAVHASATNKVLFAAAVTFLAPGSQHLVVRHGGAGIEGTVDVAPRRAPIVTYWPYFAAIPAAIGLFALNRYLKRRRRRRFTSVSLFPRTRL